MLHDRDEGIDLDGKDSTPSIYAQEYLPLGYCEARWKIRTASVDGREVRIEDTCLTCVGSQLHGAPLFIELGLEVSASGHGCHDRVRG